MSGSALRDNLNSRVDHQGSLERLNGRRDKHRLFCLYPPELLKYGLYRHRKRLETHHGQLIGAPLLDQSAPPLLASRMGLIDRRLEG